MPVRKLAKIVGAAFRDADRARKTSADPKWRKAQMADRRGTLRKFETVEHALADRAKSAAKAKANGAKTAARAKKT
jgi:hypothetical protein